MLALIERMMRRRTYRHVVKHLPHLLKRKYGLQSFYSAGQVRTALEGLKIAEGRVPAAFAVACERDEFLRVFPDLDGMVYEATRAFIAELFELDHGQVNCRHLTSRFRNPVPRAKESPFLGAARSSGDGYSGGGNSGGGD